jgi:hypothetical protein
MHTLQEGRILTDCTECDNKAEAWNDDPRPLCEWCSHAEECKPPKKFEFYSAHFTGEGRAKCKKCTFVSAYFECGCDLVHDCKSYK